MRNILKLVTVILLASSVVMGCAKPKVSKTLADLASFLNENGIRGRMEIQDPVFKIGDLVINPEKGQLERAIYTDSIGGKIQNTFIMIKLFDTEANANKATLYPEYLTGCFVITASNDSPSGKQFSKISKLFKPYK